MWKQLGLLIGLLWALGFPGAVGAQQVVPLHTDPTWQVSYWNNRSLSGTPAVQLEEANLDHDWGTGSPHALVQADNFSARWLRYIDVTPGEYEFVATADDGMRVWVDDDLIIDQWRDQSPTTYRARKQLSAGHHLIKVEYYENAGTAVAKLSWSQPTATSLGWRGEYFNNRSLSGPPALVRTDQAISFYWGAGSPAPGIVASDAFSVRWSQTLRLAAGMYRFRMTVDDGARLFVNGHLLIDAWKEQSPTTYTGDIYLSGDSALVQMEYYENSGDATAVLTWAPAAVQPTTNWRGEYYTNLSLSGPPALVRDDAAIFFRWENGSPAPGVIPADRFSVRWTQDLVLPAGRYRFDMTVDDGGRLILNNRLVLDSWREQSATTYTTIYDHAGGLLPVRMEYFENQGFATALLTWQPTQAPPPSSAIVVDNRDAGFIKGGTASGWASANEGYNNHLFWTQNNDYARAGYNWGQWTANLNQGRYELFVYIPNRYSTTMAARYWIYHAGGYTLRVVNQSAYSNRWVSLGTYNFRGGGQDFVSLSDVTYEPYLSRLIAWDAVKWEPR